MRCMEPMLISLKYRLLSRLRRLSGRGRHRNVLSVESLEPRVLLTPMSNGDDLRTYRLAVAATEEYTAFHGNSRTQAQQAIVDTIDDLNVVFRRELNLQLDLIMDLDLIFGPGNSPDSFTTVGVGSSLSPILDEGQTLFDAEIGAAGYDLGHVFAALTDNGNSSTSGSGVAGLGVLGIDGQKGRGVSASEVPTVSNIFNLAVHEFGHQFGGSHSFNGTKGNCFQRNAGTAYEPGSGSTIMSYAGICSDGSGDDDLQEDADLYFHSGSLDEIVIHLEGRDVSGVGTITAAVNQIPSVDAGNDFTIPARTPFALTASGLDADGDTVLLNYEQLDIGAAQSVDPALVDNGSSPIFRSFEPVEADVSGNFVRSFPLLNDILTGVLTKGEALPTTSRALNFRATARDQVGGIDGDDVVLTVVDTGSAFEITNLNSPTSLTGGAVQTVTWDVAGTDANGINVPTVDIHLSIDGGMTFPHSLATTANDGSHDVNLPNIDSTQVRFRISAVGNVFFEISDSDVTIVSNPAAPGVTVTETGGETALAEVAAIGAASDSYSLALNTMPMGPVELTASGGSQVLLSLDGILFSSSVTFSRSNTSVQTVHVKARNDAEIEGTHIGLVTHAVTASADAAYPIGTVINDVSVTIVDDERPPVIGVDLQSSGNSVPQNWTEINENDSVFSATTFNDLIREDGASTTVDLTVGPPGSQGITFGGSAPDESTVPIHSPSLVDAGGVLGWTRTGSNTVNADWSGLDANEPYNVYVLVAERFGGTDINHTITILGDGSDDPAPFTQTTTGFGGELRVNDQQGDSSQSLEAFALTVTADSSGEIDLQFFRNDGASNNVIYIAGLAIQSALTPSSDPGGVDFNPATGELTVTVSNDEAIVVGAQGGPAGTVDVSIGGVAVTDFGTVAPSTVESIVVNGGAGGNSIDLSGVTSADFTNSGGVVVQVAGAGGNDTISGSAFADTLDGGADSDVIIGFGGDDVLIGGDAADTLSGSGGKDSVNGGAGDDRLNGNGSTGDTLTGGPGNDTMDGGSGNDVLIETGDGDFTLTNTSLTIAGTITEIDVLSNTERAFLTDGSGSNTMDASAFDFPGLTSVSLFGGAGADALITGSGNDVLFGNAGDDTLTGNDGNDRIFGGSNSDSLIGGDGNDKLQGQGGSGDRMIGGAGNDTIRGGAGFDRVIESVDSDITLTGNSMTGNGVDVVLGVEIAVLTGGPGNNTIDASQFPNIGRNVRIFGLDGDDSLIGSSREDFLFGGNGDDTLEGNDLSDQLKGEGGDDSLVGGDGDDTLLGGDDNDIVDGGSGNDGLSGAGGMDQLFGRAGEDILLGGSDSDTLVGGDDDDILIGGLAADTLDGEAGTDTLVRGIGTGDSVAGDSAADLAEVDDFFQLNPIPSWVDEI